MSQNRDRVTRIVQQRRAPLPYGRKIELSSLT